MGQLLSGGLPIEQLHICLTPFSKHLSSNPTMVPPALFSPQIAAQISPVFQSEAPDVL